MLCIYIYVWLTRRKYFLFLKFRSGRFSRVGKLNNDDGPDTSGGSPNRDETYPVHCCLGLEFFIYLFFLFVEKNQNLKKSSAP